VNFPQHETVTLLAANFAKSKKVIDLWNEGEHNRSSRLKKNDWLPRRNKKFRKTEKSC